MKHLSLTALAVVIKNQRNRKNLHRSNFADRLVLIVI